MRGDIHTAFYHVINNSFFYDSLNWRIKFVEVLFQHLLIIVVLMM